MSDGGPAFPIRYQHDGMTLRDYFAAKAMQALIVHLKPEVGPLGYIFPTVWRPVVSGAWKLADEMLRNRDAVRPSTSEGATNATPVTQIP